MWAGSMGPPADVQMSNQVQQNFPQMAQDQPQVQQPISLLPVPYQPQPQQSLLPLPQDQEGNGLIPLPTQNLGALLPALAESSGATYVAPMYTKPRPIIPRYRAISGLLSVLIVTILLCTGAGYYAKASGKLSAFSQFTGFTPPQSLKPTPTPLLPNPGTKQVTGPAYGIINSATTTASINAVGVASQQDTVFKPNQTIYLTYSVQRPKTPGVVVIKWYTNGAFYQATRPTQPINEAINGNAQEAYPQPAEGMVELYWNNVLAIRLFFVVR